MKEIFQFNVLFLTVDTSKSVFCCFEKLFFDKDKMNLVYCSLLLIVLHVNGSFCKTNRCHGDTQSSEALASGANDVVVVRQPNGLLDGTPVNLQIGKFSNWMTIFKSRKNRPVTVIVNNFELKLDSKFLIRGSGTACFDDKSRPDKFTHEELLRMNLKAGHNEGLFVVPSLSVEVPFSIYFLEQNSRLVITDIDGTITESDIKGLVFPQLGMEAHQDNVIELFQRISGNNYTIIYLTARSMANDADTRKYLFQDLQNYEGFSLPFGPLFMSPMPFGAAAYEAVTNPSNTKAATLRDLTQLFVSGKDIIYGAYGNSNTDVEAYLKVGIRSDLIYLVDESGKLRQVANGSGVTSYGQQAQQVNELYP